MVWLESCSTMYAKMIETGQTLIRALFVNKKEDIMDSRDRKPTGQPVVFSMPNEECIWSKAGVIAATECVNAFDCLGCSLEKSVRASFKNELEASGKTESRTCGIRPFMPKGKCRHVLSGRLSYGQCACDSCARCPVEQMIEDSIHLPISGRTSHTVISGFDVARNYYYYQGHTWARVEYGGWVRVGVDDFALRLLGQQDVIETSPLGSVLRQGQPAGTLRRAGKEASIISPVDGVVVAINHKVLEKAFIANDAPYEDGWLMLIQPTNLQENLKNLLFDAEGLSWIDDEAISLNTLLAEESRFELIAAGSETPRDVIEQAPEIGWERLVMEFLQ